MYCFEGLVAQEPGMQTTTKKKRIVSSEKNQGLLLSTWCVITSGFVHWSVLACSVLVRFGALYHSVTECSPQYKSLDSLYLLWQRGLFVLDGLCGWCGALKVVDWYRPKDVWECSEYMSAEKKDVQSMQGKNRELVRCAGCGLCSVCSYCIQGVFPECWHCISFICGVKKIRVD